MVYYVYDEIRKGLLQVKYGEGEQIMNDGQICPVCGKYTFEEYDSYDICPVCGWEDDGLQRDEPDLACGANGLSLNQYREQYRSRMKTQSEEGSRS